MWLNIRKLKACRAANSFTLHQGTDQCKHAYVSKSSTERSPSAAASRLPSAATASEQTYDGFTICEVLLITYTHAHPHPQADTHTYTHKWNQARCGARTKTQHREVAKRVDCHQRQQREIDLRHDYWPLSQHITFPRGHTLMHTEKQHGEVTQCGCQSIAISGNSERANIRWIYHLRHVLLGLFRS